MVTDYAGRQRLVVNEQGLEELAPLWVTPDDLLIIGVRNSLAGVTLNVEGRLWGPGGDFMDPFETVSPPADSTLNFTSINLGYGYLVSAGVQAVGSTLPRRGQTYCTLQVGRPPKATFRNAKPLASGYVSGSQFLAWPGGRVQDAIEGPGFLQSLAGTAPGPGADWTQTVTTNQRWRIRSVRASLTTAVAAGSRRPRLIVDDGANTLMDIDPNVTQAPSLTVAYDWIPGYPSTGILIVETELNIPADLQLFSGWRIRSLTDAIQGADQWTAPRFGLESWIED